MSAQAADRLQVVVGEGYRLLEPAQKYTRAFCTDEEIIIAQTIRDFVTREIKIPAASSGVLGEFARFASRKFYSQQAAGN